MSRQEDIAAESILKRAELTRITKQLKSRLSKTNLKSKLKEKSLNSNSNSNNIIHNGGINKINITPQKSLKHKKSIDSNYDAYKTEDENSPIKSSIHQTNLPPSSPLYEEFQIPIIPKTPPQQKINLNTDIYNSNSTNKTQPNFSSPVRGSAQQGQQQGGQPHLQTPKRGNHHDEGADLLMFLATSPSPIQYKNYPSTPQRSQSHLALNSSTSKQPQHQQQSLPNSSSINSLNKFATPNTPKRNPLINSNNLINLSKTPGFNMNDYVNLFSPSPRITRTPGGFINNGQQVDLNGEKDINGKLIKF
ncbi:Minor capsid protein [Wickerhamomyces ciferrii]|uniref:Minor capsid protein n=1 Tax=Wickerhamomyces ciferrii (strain ATCC 14091 / BCRC 22168 / CBS 111 / JCM 3599 / NBRC 0793 / NRRL Y-1031 F-60-10) TaxID=1206466 RepID=K0KCU6_WICCF|nr:Minor capsid protein [Wickerhamomyces ciferrii]CCH42920.1 Minor capsid protein [Wickerhamomyces ciferrii]